MFICLSFFFFNASSPPSLSFFFFNDTATTEIYTLSLHDALPISLPDLRITDEIADRHGEVLRSQESEIGRATSELQSHLNLVCRLLLEKKKKKRLESKKRENE